MLWCRWRRSPGITGKLDVPETDHMREGAPDAVCCKHGQSILYTSAEIIDCIPQRGGGLLRGLHKFEEPQLLHGNGSVHQAHRRFGAIDDQGFVRRQWHQGALW
jgi:hypothetical protein